MASARVFLLDANVFIEAKRRYYAFDLCPGFWDCLIWHHGAARIQSIDRVRQELERGGDDLSDWVVSVMPAPCLRPTPAGRFQFRMFAKPLAFVMWIHSVCSRNSEWHFPGSRPPEAIRRDRFRSEGE